MYTVLKRDGKIVDFDLKKISDAITLAFDAQEKEYNTNIIDFLALKVTADFEPKIKDHNIAVEDIQDLFGRRTDSEQFRRHYGQLLAVRNL